MPNDYTTLASSLVTKLLADLGPTYVPNLKVEKRVFDPAKCPDFDKYCIIVSPPQANPWEERVVAVRQFQFIFRADLYLLVKNFNEVDSVFGVTAPDFGIFQMVNDVKVLLRGHDFSDFLDATYSEPAGPLSIEYAATSGFDSGEHPFIRRAKLGYTARTKPFCVAIAP